MMAAMNETMKVVNMLQSVLLSLLLLLLLLLLLSLSLSFSRKPNSERTIVFTTKKKNYTQTHTQIVLE